MAQSEIKSKVIVIGQYQACLDVLRERKIRRSDSIIVTPSALRAVRGYTGPFEIIWLQDDGLTPEQRIIIGEEIAIGEYVVGP